MDAKKFVLETGVVITQLDANDWTKLMEEYADYSAKGLKQAIVTTVIGWAASDKPVKDLVDVLEAI